MLDVNKIRTAVLLVAEPGLFTEQAVRSIVDEAERYRREPRTGNPDIDAVREPLIMALAVARGGTHG